MRCRAVQALGFPAISVLAILNALDDWSHRRGRGAMPDEHERRSPSPGGRVVNWFTSFGYFDAATNDAVLAGFAHALLPEGRLALELLNPGAALPAGWRTVRS
jgi:hypothetical protein